ncbi:hypothetical protein OZK63_42655, partial [Streptomyces sp. UMAF16]|nr:hypothetical protein [Streptomyces sp. UMAF16]
MLAGQENYFFAENFVRSNTANIIEAKDEKVVAELFIDQQKFTIFLQKNEERNFDTGCNCNSDTHHPLCVHK